MTDSNTITTTVSEVLKNRPAALGLMIAGILLIAIGFILLLTEKKTEKKLGAARGARAAAPVDIELYSKSVIGDRSYQQDYCIIPKNIRDDRLKNVGTLAIVCDGMGGMEGGEQASRCCAEMVYGGYYQIGSTEDVCALLRGLIVEANKEVANFTAENGRKLNSGTTVVVAVYLHSKIYWASVGDSRIYLYHNGALTQITRDHNLGEKLRQDLENGLITKEQFDSAKQKEALVSYVGMGQSNSLGQPMLIDTGELSFSEGSGDILILCSDGIYKTASYKTICKTIEQTKTVRDLPDALITAALTGGQAGKHDNISAIVMKRK